MVETAQNRNSARPGRLIGRQALSLENPPHAAAGAINGAPVPPTANLAGCSLAGTASLRPVSFSDRRNAEPRRLNLQPTGLAARSAGWVHAGRRVPGVSVCPYVSMSVCLDTYIPASLYYCVSVHLYACVFVCLYAGISVYLYISTYARTSARLYSCVPLR